MDDVQPWKNEDGTYMFRAHDGKHDCMKPAERTNRKGGGYGMFTEMRCMKCGYERNVMNQLVPNYEAEWFKNPAERV